MHLKKLSASDPSGFSTIKAMRQNHQAIIYNEKNFAIRERQRDSLGLVFLIYQENTPVGTFRLVQTGHNLTVTERVSNIEDLISIPDTWELERFIVSDNFRGLKNIMDIYRTIALWLKNNTEIIHVVAICNRRVAALLKRTGLRVLAKEIEIDNTHSNYLLLSAAVSDICNKIL